MIGDSNDKTNFPHELLLSNRQVSNLLKAFANYLSTDIKLSKTQLSKMIQFGEFLGRLIDPLLKAGLPLIKNVIKPLGKSVLIPLGLMQQHQQQMQKYIKIILGSGEHKQDKNTATLIILNNEMQDILLK